MICRFIYIICHTLKILPQHCLAKFLIHCILYLTNTGWARCAIIQGRCIDILLKLFTFFSPYLSTIKSISNSTRIVLKTTQYQICRYKFSKTFFGHFHCVKYRHLTLFPGVEILWKRTNSAEFRENYPKLCGGCVFPQSFYIRKLGEILVMYTVFASDHLESRAVITLWYFCWGNTNQLHAMDILSFPIQCF